MAPPPNARSAAQARDNVANDSPSNGPPPSTLAAQLVENISASVHSSRPDEIVEIKKLFAVIENVKDHPNTLSSPEERLTHNHMLIYVYARIVLEGHRWDDPFADLTQSRAEAITAITFLKVTIQETPDVLLHVPPTNAFIFRGREPLWIWVLPKVLKMLGHSHCNALAAAIEDFLHVLILLACQTGSLWHLIPQLLHYLRCNFDTIQNHLEGLSSTESIRDVGLRLQLPSGDFLEKFAHEEHQIFQEQCTYRIPTLYHALRHMLSLLVIMTTPLTTEGTSETVVSCFLENVPWLLDSYVTFTESQTRWRLQDFGTRTVGLQNTLKLLNVFQRLDDVDRSIEEKASAVLARLCANTIRHTIGLSKSEVEKDTVKLHLSLALLKLAQECMNANPVSRLASLHVLPALDKLALHGDIPEGTDLWRSAHLLQRSLEGFNKTDLTHNVLPVNFCSEELRQQVGNMGIKCARDDVDEPQNKRRKISTESKIIQRLLQLYYKALGLEWKGGTDNMREQAQSSFPGLCDAEKNTAINIMGQICCATDDTVLLTQGYDGYSNLRCSLCQGQITTKSATTSVDNTAKMTIFEIFDDLVVMPSFKESRRTRVTAMHTLRRLATHASDEKYLSLESSAAATWCMQSLISSARELRLAAVRTFPVFLKETTVCNLTVIVDKNRDLAVKHLRALSGQNAPEIKETCILAWSQVGRIGPEELLQLALVKLVDYLGHEDAITQATAFNEILNLARFHRLSPRQLLDPYWRILAFSAVKDLATQPRTSRYLAELLEMPMSDFLLLIQSFAVPYLVLHKKQDVITKIADVRKQQAWQVCLDNDNLGPILALLLVQDTDNVQDQAMSLLRHISPHFDGFGLVELLRIEPVMTALELLKAAADADDNRKPLVRGALSMAASWLHKDSKQKKGQAIAQFLQSHVLGLMARLTDIFNEVSRQRPPIEEQKRCIKAMEEMIRVGKRHVRIARPQMSACILSAMPDDKLRAPAFSCWTAMLTYLDEEDVEVLIETTFFLVNQYWHTFNDSSQSKAQELLGCLLDKQKPILEETINKLPSLGHIAPLSEIEVKLSQMRRPVDSRTAFYLLAERISHDNSGVVIQALRELASYLQRQQGYLQASVVSEQPDTVIVVLARALLDCAAKYSADESDIGRLCAESMGMLGCLDPNRIETVRAEKQIVLVNNFADSIETTNFVLRIIDDVLVKSFLSATDTKLQGFLSYTIQEMLERCNVPEAIKQAGGREFEWIYRQYLGLSERTREIINPFLNSRYVLVPMKQQELEYPVFRPGRGYNVWMRNFTIDLLRKPQETFAMLLFEPLCRAIRLKDLSTAEFLLPYLVLHVTIGESTTAEERQNILAELLTVLQHEVPENASYAEREDKKLYYEAVFRVLDYAMRWLQKKRARSDTNAAAAAGIERVQKILDSIPAELISQRAVDCKSYSRALFHLEQHIRQVEETKKDEVERERLLQRLQDIYTQIDEPDGLEGISSHLHVLDIHQQVLSHKKAGRWTAAQTYYEMKQAKNPYDVDIQIDLLTCLKESGQHDVLLNHVEGIEKYSVAPTIDRIIPYAVEASWATGRWEAMQKFVSQYQGDRTENFNVSVAQALLHLHGGWKSHFIDDIKTMRDRIASSMTYTATASLEACHETMLKCHVLTDLELIAGVNSDGSPHPQETLQTLNRRLEVVGAYVNDKQYILGVRRAAMELVTSRFTNLDISALWLASARLARKANLLHQSFNAVLHASQLGDDSATIENARLLWKDGHNRKAIQTLQGAIANSVFIDRSFSYEGDSLEKNSDQQSLLAARAHLLLAKWLDNAGQTHASALRHQYQNVPKNYAGWEKGHYYLGRHYKKVLESEKVLKPDDQSDEYITGETAKLVIENYFRSLNYGTKYLYQTLPRILTLWLELGAQIDKAPEGKVSVSQELHQRRKQVLRNLHTFIQKYAGRLPAYIFYSALPQIVARIAHPNDQVYKLLELIIIKVVEAHPRQGLWSMFAVVTSRQANERRARGQQIIQKLRGGKQKVDGASFDLKSLIRMGEKLAEQLLVACNNGDFQSNRTTHASITRDLNFNHKCTPCPLVVPVESCLTATLPTLTDNVKKHQAFSRDVITIESFLDDVLVLGSLAKPRKLTARGSDGKNYGLLIKPKDDLRTDQRLMEFNGIINRALKRDAESSRRQLYIRTYAVTPLNEECGIIEWVDGLKTLRDILLTIYRSRGIAPNYSHLAQKMKHAVEGENNIQIFTETVLGMFPPVLQYWFMSQFPNPSTWFAARLKYTRSCAVMSMVGTILGLGDRHGENVLLEEGNGGVFHVDFNCLFDKGLTFAQPERVPFRLTHNMVAAMGIYGYEGPFRKCSELTLSILRQQEETLMTILEAFIYDPTLDLQKDKKRKHEVVKLNPRSVVESIKRKVRGLLPDESIPLGVEGQVEELIKQAVDPRNLSAMYIGWCPFL